MVSRQSFLPLVIPRSATDSLTSKVRVGVASSIGDCLLSFFFFSVLIRCGSLWFSDPSGHYFCCNWDKIREGLKKLLSSFALQEKLTESLLKPWWVWSINSINTQIHKLLLLHVKNTEKQFFLVFFFFCFFFSPFFFCLFLLNYFLALSRLVGKEHGKRILTVGWVFVTLISVQVDLLSCGVCEEHIWFIEITLEIIIMNFAAGLAAGMYSGLTYGLREARGAHDWVTIVSYG